MKEIIYLDTGVLHSFMAQHNDGLPTGTSNERGEEVNDATEKAKGYNSRSSVQSALKTGTFEVPLIFKSPEGEVKGIFQPGNFASEKSFMSQTESGKEIISKQLHDNALVEFEQHLTEREQIFSIEDMNIEGKFVKCKSEFKIIDFKYLQRIIQTEKLVKFMFINEEDELQTIKKEADDIQDKQQRLNAQAYYKSLKTKFDQGKNLMSSQFKFMEESMSYLNDILPTDAFIVMGNVIAPLKNDYLREKASELTFKYGGSSSSIQVTMIGKVTSIVDSIDSPDFEGSDAFFDFPKILNSVLHPLGLINIDDVIVSPVAIYFE